MSNKTPITKIKDKKFILGILLIAAPLLVTTITTVALIGSDGVFWSLIRSVIATVIFFSVYSGVEYLLEYYGDKQ